MKIGEGKFINKTVPTIIYLNSKKVNIQLAVFYNLEDFKWIGIDEKRIGKARMFGDVSRAFHK